MSYSHTNAFTSCKTVWNGKIFFFLYTFNRKHKHTFMVKYTSNRKHKHTFMVNSVNIQFNLFEKEVKVIAKVNSE